MNFYECVKTNLKETTEDEMQKLRDELRYRADDLNIKLSDEDISDIAERIKHSGFFISNDIFTDSNDEYEWQQINDFLDDEIRYYKDNILKESEVEHTKDYKQLEKELDKDTIDKIDAVLNHYIKYTDENDDGDKDIIEEYYRKFGNGYVIDWYEGLMSTEDFINEIKNGYEVELIPEGIDESQTQENDAVLKALEKKHPEITKYLDEYYKEIADTEPRPAYDKEKDRMDPAWENWNKTTNNVLYSKEAWDNFVKWVEDKYDKHLNESDREYQENNGTIQDINGKKYYLAEQGWQGYYYKDENTYNNDPDGICYITEGGFDDYYQEFGDVKDIPEGYVSAIPADYLEKNKEKLIEWGSIDTHNSIKEGVRAVLEAEEYYYEFDSGEVIEAKDFDDELIEEIAYDAFTMVDWQTTNGFLSEREWNDTIEDYYEKKELKESEAEDEEYKKQVEEEGKIADAIRQEFIKEKRKTKKALEKICKKYNMDVDSYLYADGYQGNFKELKDELKDLDEAETSSKEADELNKGSHTGETYVCVRPVTHPNMGTLIFMDEVITLGDYDGKGNYTTDAGPYVTEEELAGKYFKKYDGPIYIVKADGEEEIKMCDEEAAYDYILDHIEWDDRDFSIVSPDGTEKNFDELDESENLKETGASKNKAFYCEWCGTDFNAMPKPDGTMPNCPHCRKDRYKDDPEKDADGHANKDVHFSKEIGILDKDEYDALDYYLDYAKLYDSGMYLVQDPGHTDYFTDSQEDTTYDLKEGLEIVYESMVPESIAEFPEDIQKGLEKLMRNYLGDEIGNEVAEWCSGELNEAEKKENAMNLYESVKSNLKESKNGVSFELDPDQLRVYKNGEIIGQLEGRTDDFTDEDLDEIADHFEKYGPGLFGEVLKVIEDKGWSYNVNEGDCEVGIENWSPAGEDMYDYISYGSNDLSDDEKGKNLIESIGQLAENFDADEHAEMYIDMRGQNGVPNDIRTLIDDADDIKKMYEDLYDSVLALERNRA